MIPDRLGYQAICRGRCSLVAEEGKLQLDQAVGRWIPGLTAGDKVTLRSVLSHTSGFRDFWPQDYVPEFMEAATSADAEY